MSKRKLHKIPDWMHIDTRPLDKGEWQQYGYGYSRPVTNYERWRPATRYIRRTDTPGFRSFKVITLMPGYYYVSDHGRIWSAYTGNIMKYSKRKRWRTALVDASGKHVKIRAYKLALDNFVEPPDNIKNVVYYLMNVVNHRDNRPYHDWLNNLQYSTFEANNQHARNYYKQQKN